MKFSFLTILGVALSAGLVVAVPQAQADHSNNNNNGHGHQGGNTPTGASDTGFIPDVASTTTTGFHSTQGSSHSGAAWTNGLGSNANVFTASGTIQKYIKFNSVDSSLELGDIGNPTFVGDVFSASTAASGGTVVGGATDGLAGVTFDANTYVQVQAQGQNSLLNIGADGVPTAPAAAAADGDDYRLPVAYALSAKGLYSTPTTGQAPAGNVKDPHLKYVGTGGFGPFSAFVSAPGSNTGLSASNTPGATSAANNMVVTFEPNGAGGGTGSNGFQIAAKVKRNGLNDYHGKYTGTVELKYWQW